MNTLLNHRLCRLDVGIYAVAFIARFASSSLKILLTEICGIALEMFVADCDARLGVGLIGGLIITADLCVAAIGRIICVCGEIFYKKYEIFYKK